MSTKRRVLLEDAEPREIQRLARGRHMTVAEWVRQALRAARRREPKGDGRRKIEAVRAAARHSFASGDIGQLLEDTERGYRSGSAP